MCNLSCISVPPVPLPLWTPPEGRCWAGTALLHNSSSRCSPGLERGGQRAEAAPVPLRSCYTPLAAVTNLPCLPLFQGPAGSQAWGGKESEVRMSRVPGREASCRGGSGHRASSLVLVAAVLPAVEEKGPFIPTLAPPQPPPTSLAWWTENLCAGRA